MTFCLSCEYECPKALDSYPAHHVDGLLNNVHSLSVPARRIFSNGRVCLRLVIVGVLGRGECRGMVWPLTPKFHTATRPFLKINM